MATALMGLWIRCIITILFRLELKNRHVLLPLRSFCIVANHQCKFDPFLLNMGSRRQFQYIISDSNLRHPLASLFFGLVGVIPKTKQMPDSETVRNVIRARRAGGIIGLFPEGQSSWDGTTQPLNVATARLLQMLGLPVVCAIINGSFLCMPRWGRSVRRGYIGIEYQLAFSPQQLRELSSAQLQERLTRLLARSEYDFQRHAQHAYRSARRAEYLEIALFLCPACKQRGRLRSYRNRLTCYACGYAVHYTVQGFFEPLQGRLHYDTVRDWNRWQTEHFRRQLGDYHGRYRRTPPSAATLPPILSESGAWLRRGFKTRRLQTLCSGRLELYPTCLRLVVDTRHTQSAQWAAGTQHDFQLVTIEGCNIQNGELLEFYYRDILYQVRFFERRANVYKWNVGIVELSTITSTPANTK